LKKFNNVDYANHNYSNHLVTADLKLHHIKDNNGCQSKVYNGDWWTYRYVNFAQIARMRDAIDITNYWKRLCDFVAMNEGCVVHGYPDCAHYSIGFGLLFKRSDRSDYEPFAIKAFHHALGINLHEFIPLSIFNETPYQICNFLKIYQLSVSDCCKLLSYALETNEGLINARIRNFSALSPNKKIAIHSLWYNSPSLIGPNFTRALDAYTNSGDMTYLLDCIYEIECNSNSAQGELYFGIQNRRYREAIMFSNRALDFLMRVPEQYFAQFLYELRNDMPNLYEALVGFDNLADSVEDSVKRAILEHYVCSDSLPDLAYIAEKMRRIKKNG